MTLDSLNKNEAGIIIKINNDELAIQLLSMGFILGEKVKIIRKAPLNDPIIISSGNNQISIRRKDASKISVNKI